jgi:hypothetical protein
MQTGKISAALMPVDSRLGRRDDSRTSAGWEVLEGNSVDDWRYWLTRAAFAAGILWLTVLAWLTGTRHSGTWRQRFPLATPALALLAAIAELLYA